MKDVSDRPEKMPSGFNFVNEMKITGRTSQEQTATHHRINGEHKAASKNEAT